MTRTMMTSRNTLIDLQINDPVIIIRSYPHTTTNQVYSEGIVAYLGPVKFNDRSNDWVGIRLTGDSIGLGKNDGSVSGERYFKCCHNSGIFVRKNKVIQRVDLQINDPVIITRSYPHTTTNQVYSEGIVAYLGPVKFNDRSNDWVGIRLTGDSIGLGKNDGSVSGERYFKCCHNSGIFVRKNKVIQRVSTNKLPKGLSSIVAKATYLKNTGRGGRRNTSNSAITTTAHRSSLKTTSTATTTTTTTTPQQAQRTTTEGTLSSLSSSGSSNSTPQLLSTSSVVIYDQISELVTQVMELQTNLDPMPKKLKSKSCSSSSICSENEDNLLSLPSSSSVASSLTEEESFPTTIEVQDLQQRRSDETLDFLQKAERDVLMIHHNDDDDFITTTLNSNNITSFSPVSSSKMKLSSRPYEQQQQQKQQQKRINLNDITNQELFNRNSNQSLPLIVPEEDHDEDNDKEEQQDRRWKDNDSNSTFMNQQWLNFWLINFKIQREELQYNLKNEKEKNSELLSQVIDLRSKLQTNETTRIQLQLQVTNLQCQLTPEKGK